VTQSVSPTADDPASHNRDMEQPPIQRSRQLAWSAMRPWGTNAALLIIGVAMFWLARQLVLEYHHFTIGFSGVSGWAATLYVAAVLLILTQPANRVPPACPVR
jgi:hypothetical protein